MANPDRFIDVYDNLATFHQRDGWFKFIRESLFRVNGSDGFGDGYRDQIYSSFSEEDLKNMGFIGSNLFSFLDSKYGISKLSLGQARVNLTTSSERNKVHTDLQGITVLYYANLSWELDWGGHTLFMDDDLNEAQLTCLYRPGRVVVFDGSIPHMILTPNVACPTTRFTLALQYHTQD